MRKSGREESMSILDFLKNRSGGIVKKAAGSFEQMHTGHFDADGLSRLRLLLLSILRAIHECLRHKSTEPVIQYAEEIARERFSSGFALDEVQVAFNVLEDAIWTQLSHEPDLGGLAKGFQGVRKLLRLGKDRFTQEYLEFSAEAKAPSMNIRALFEGTTIAADGDAKIA
jgi:hypothetical protein